MSGFKIDFWTLIGIAAQALFLGSFILQWYQSEKRQRSYLSVEFWVLRIIAAMIIVVYSIVRKDLVFFISAVMQMMLYARNIQLIKQREDK